MTDAHDESSSRGAEPGFLRVWLHAWFSTYGTWLRGDVRGFRDHDHRIHSSGDYTHPPPAHEHAGLRRWTRENMHKAPVRLTPALRQQAGEAIVNKLQLKGVELLVLALGADHAHLLGRFPADQVRALVGHAKRTSSHAIRDHIPGVVWAKKCAIKRIKSRQQQLATFNYIVNHRNEGAWVWTFRDRPSA